MIDIPRQCPSYDRCSANACPLDPAYPAMRDLPGDETCRAHRPTRTAIAAGHQALLPWGGLTRREQAHDRRSAAAKARLAAMSPEDRERRLAPLRRHAAKR